MAEVEVHNTTPEPQPEVVHVHEVHVRQVERLEIPGIDAEPLAAHYRARAERLRDIGIIHQFADAFKFRRDR